MKNCLPIEDGEGDQAEPGGGVIGSAWEVTRRASDSCVIYPSTMLRMVPLPIWRWGGDSFRREQPLRPAEVDADEAADALLDHRHPEQAVHPAHRHRIVGDDQVPGLRLVHHPVEQVAEAF